MYEQLTEQFQTSLEPAKALFDINLKAAEKLAEQQSDFINATLSDGFSYVKDLGGQTDIAGYLKIQKEYSEDFQDKLISASKDIYTLMVTSQEKKNAIWKEAFVKAQDLTATMAAPVQPAPKRKTAKSSAK